METLQEKRKKRREYSQRPEVKIRMKQDRDRYRNKPETKEKEKEYRRRPENKIRIKKYRQQPEVKKQISEYNSRPENKIKKCERLHRQILTDPNYKLRKNLRGRIKKSIKIGNKCKTGSVLILLGCTIKEVREYIESKWKKGMNWQNLGGWSKKGTWQIHHIKPCHTFDLTDKQQQLECFNYKNLEPLWTEEHKSKHYT